MYEVETRAKDVTVAIGTLPEVCGVQVAASEVVPRFCHVKS